MKKFSQKIRYIITGMMMVMVTVFMTGCGGADKSATKQAGDKLEIKLAYHLPTNHHLAKGMESFAKKVAEKSQGSIKINTYPAGQLYNDKSMNDAIMSGGLDMGLNSTAMWTTVIPAMNVLDVPFLLTNYDAVAKALNGEVGKTLAAEMQKKGVRPLIWADYGYVQFANSKAPIKKPEDFKGLKLRGYGEIPAETIKALGGSPVTMGSAEVYMAIQRGTIDGQTSGTTAMYDRKMYEVTKYLTMTNHAFCEFVLAVNDKFWGKLTPDQQKILQDAADEVRDDIRKATKAEDEKAMKQLQEKGMEVYNIPAADLPQWQAATKPVQDDFIKRTGAIGQKLVEECLAASK